MTEVEHHPQNEVATREPGDLSALARWALDAQQAFLVAQSLAETSFVPSSMKKKPGEITAAILTGQEIGLQPMSALRSIDVIQGTPAMRANALRGLVQSRGHEVWVVESGESRAIVAGQRARSDKVQKSTWTIERARQLGLTAKDNWKKQPGAMLVARATAEVCRLIASDVLLGMPYAVEELEQDDAPAPRRTARRAPVAAAPVDEPDLDAAEPVGDKEDPQEPAAEDSPETAEPPLADWPEVKEPGDPS